MPPKKARVLDYGAGSGVIGAALRLREPTVDLHLLDSDALALEAAAKNLPGSSRYVLLQLPPPPPPPIDRFVLFCFVLVNSRGNCWGATTFCMTVVGASHQCSLSS